MKEQKMKKMIKKKIKIPTGKRFSNVNSSSKLNLNNINNIYESEKPQTKETKLRKDKNGKPYLEYIININYDNNKNWNISRRFNQFTNLYKTLRTLSKENFELPESSNIFSNITAMFSGLSHENKIIQLEKFLKDLSETNVINTSKPFRKFLEFEQYIDEDNEVIVNIGSNHLRVNGNNLGDTYEKINGNNADKSLDESI